MHKRLLLMLAAVPMAAGGFTIGQFDPIHERLALMSEQCVAFDGQLLLDNDYGGRISCRFDEARLRAARKTLSRWPHKQTSLEEAVRWGDDPGRGLRHIGRGSDYLWQLKVTCDRQIFDGPDQNRFLPVYRAGIMCSGHYGRLGFFHSMMSSDDAAAIIEAERTGTDVSLAKADAQRRTRDKILAWAMFTYRVAKGDLSPDVGFCDAVSVDPRLHDVFDDGNDCRTADAEWTVRRFFTFACPNPKIDAPCKTSYDGDATVRTADDRDAMVRLAALGSLLHMVQDSYAQGHVRRLDEPVRDGNKLAAVIACASPKQYYYYDKANRDDGHGKADGAPSVRECGQSAVDDPVSAGATLLWLLRNSRSADDVNRYLSQRVYPTGKS